MARAPRANEFKKGGPQMRNIIAALQVSVDGFIEGSGGEIDWIDCERCSAALVDRLFSAR
jgi:hypothetical protein